MPENSEQGEKRKLSAIMFTDIKGFSKRMGEDEEGTFRLLKKHSEMINPIIKKYDGRVVKTIGDAIMGDFGSVLNAVKCAWNIQKHFHKLNKMRDESDVLQIRIGIHLGDVIVSENDLYGDGVNIAARLEPFAEPGGICISEIVYNSVKNQLPLNYEDAGLQSFKNIKEPIRVYKISPVEPPPKGEKAKEKEETQAVEYSEPILKFKNQLEQFDVEEAKRVAKREKINNKSAISIVKQVINELAEKEEFRKAYKIGKEFSLSETEIFWVINGEFEKLYKSGQYEDAALWGLHHKIPEEKLVPAVKKYFLELVGREASISEFQKFLDNFGFMKKELKELAIREFKNLYSMEKYETCVFFGKQFNIMGKEVSEIAVKALVQSLEKSNYPQIESLIIEFNVFSDKIFKNIANENLKKKLGNLFLDNYVLPKLKKGEFEDLKNKLQSFNFFKVKFYDKYLYAIQDEIVGNAVSLHNRLIENDNFKIAKILKNEFDLLNKPEKFKIRLLEAVEIFHNSLLKSGRNELAIIVKNEYNLFTEKAISDSLYKAMSSFIIESSNKGDFESIEKTLSEYKIPKNIKNKMLKKILIDAFKKQEFDTVFKLKDFGEIQLSDEDLGDDLINNFKMLLSEKRYEFAAKLYKKFGIKKIYIEDMVYKCWKLELKNKNYETAYKIKKLFGIRKKTMDSIVKNLYEKNIKNKNYNDAYHLRLQYGIKIGIFDWFKEFFLKLFK